MIYSFKCILCGKDYDIFQHMNDTHEYFCCAMRCERIWTLPYTNRDLMYQFKTGVFNNRITEIYSKRQYGRLLKENGLKTMTTEELRTMKPKAGDRNKRKQLAKKICRRMQEGGVMKEFVPFAKKYYSKKK